MTGHKTTRKKGGPVFTLALAGGATICQAAKQAGIAERTAHRRLESAAFRRRVQRARSELIERASAILANATSEASATIWRLVRSPDERVALAAARIALQLAPTVRDHCELAERITALEAKIDTEHEHEP